MASGWSLSLQIGLVTAFFALCPRANATLGESVDTVDTDMKALSAMKRSARNTGHYTVHSLDVSGTVVREYASISGTVFGVAWNGISHPDLSHLLGAYFSDYQSYARQTPRTPGVRHQSVKGSHVVVEMWGHMRSLHGRAFDPSLIPTGVDANEIQ